MNRIVGFFILIFLLNTSNAQDTLPRFTIVERGEKVTISWINPYESVVQLNVQRSYDSLLNFRTVFSPISPELPQNGFTEPKKPTNQIFYRIFYVLKGGAYFFTKSQRVGNYTASRDVRSSNITVKGDYKGLVTINIRDQFYTKIPSDRYTKFRDSVINRTRDTINAINDSLVVIAPFSNPSNFRASMYVYSIKDGINISLPTSTQKYSLKFFEENGTPLFEINNLKEQQLTLDKTNFLHAGWFLFELYEDNRLKEKNKFYLSKDF